MGEAKQYDLEERTFTFAKRVREFTRKLPRTVENIEDIKQLVRASGSVAANYIEANGSLGKRDFLMKIRTCRKESKESGFFLRLVDPDPEASVQEEQKELVQEALELAHIFGSILRKSE